MNVIDIVILVIVGASVVYGFYRGFMRTILSVACLLISLFVAFTFGPQLSAKVSQSQGVRQTLANYTDAVARVGDYNLASTPVSQLSDDVITRVLESVSLPKSISSILEGNLKKSFKEFLGVTAKVRLMQPHSIERSEGKAKRIIDRRKDI